MTLATAALVQVGSVATAPAGGLDLAVRASQTGELAVSRAERPLAPRRDLRAGSGSVAARRSSATRRRRRSSSRVRARSETPDLDDALAIVVHAGSRTVYRGSVRGLRARLGELDDDLRRAAPSSASAPGCPSGARSGWEGRDVDLGLDLSSIPGARTPDVMSLRARIAATAAVLAVLGAAIGDSTWSAFAGLVRQPRRHLRRRNGDPRRQRHRERPWSSSPAPAPGEAATGCIKFTYTGSLPSTLRYYATVTGSLAPFLTVKVTRGTQGAATFPSCTGFTADTRNYVGAGAGVLAEAALSAIDSTYATGLDDPDNATGAVETWTSGESHVLQITVTMGSSTSAQGLSAGLTVFAEARNQ